MKSQTLMSNNRDYDAQVIETRSPASRMSKELELTGDQLNELLRGLQFADALSEKYGDVVPIVCKRCGHHTGCYANHREFAMGHFEGKPLEYQVPLEIKVYRNTRIKMRCPYCCRTTSWCPARN